MIRVAVRSSAKKLSVVREVQQRVTARPVPLAPGYSLRAARAVIRYRTDATKRNFAVPGTQMLPPNTSSKRTTIFPRRARFLGVSRTASAGSGAQPFF